MLFINVLTKTTSTTRFGGIRLSLIQFEIVEKRTARIRSLLARLALYFEPEKKTNSRCAFLFHAILFSRSAIDVNCGGRFTICCVHGSARVDALLN